MRIRRYLALFLAAALFFFSGCQTPQPQGGQTEFDRLLEELLPEFVDMTDFSSRYYFLHPEDYGLARAGSGFSLPTGEEWEASFEETRQALASLETINRDALDDSSQLTLQIVKDTLERSLALEDFYLLSCADPGISGSLTQLATLVAHAPYQSREDLDALFEMYAKLPDVCAEFIRMENERQAQGAGMTRSEIDLALEEYDRLARDAEELGADVINAASFLTPGEKEAYLLKNAQAAQTYLVPALGSLRDALDEMAGRGGVPGLAGRTDGDRYYLALLRQKGIDETPARLMQELKEAYRACAKAVSQLAGRIDPALLSQFLEDPAGFSFIEADSAKDIVDWQRRAAPAAFPDAETGETQVVLTPAVLRESGTVAYYMLRPLDEEGGASRNIYINDDKAAGDFLTLAHEGFPGHLYQDAYTAALGRSPVRRLAERSYEAALEGWGVYSSLAAAELTQDNTDVAVLAALLDLCDRLIYAYADVACNYFGWTAEQLRKNLQSQFQIEIPDIEGEFTAVLCAMPGVYLSYGIGGLRILKMREEAMNALGEEYTAKEFHAALLAVLPASFAQMEEAVQEYIAQRRRKEAA